MVVLVVVVVLQLATGCYWWVKIVGMHDSWYYGKGKVRTYTAIY